MVIERTSVFIDGFNLYNGIKEGYGRKYLWLDLQKLAASLLKPYQELGAVHYFSAPIRNKPESQARQRTYLAALAASTSVIVTLGHYQKKEYTCRACGRTHVTYEEKETDVSIATAMVEGAAMKEFDVALVISGDGDLCPAFRAVARLHPSARSLAVFPPKRHSDELRKIAYANFTIGEANLRRSQLPESVTSREGTEYSRPASWS